MAATRRGERTGLDVVETPGFGEADGKRNPRPPLPEPEGSASSGRRANASDVVVGTARPLALEVIGGVIRLNLAQARAISEEEGEGGNPGYGKESVRQSSCRHV